MEKKRIKLTEKQLNKVIQETVKKIITEIEQISFVDSMWSNCTGEEQAKQQDADWKKDNGVTGTKEITGRPTITRNAEIKSLSKDADEAIHNASHDIASNNILLLTDLDFDDDGDYEIITNIEDAFEVEANECEDDDNEFLTNFMLDITVEDKIRLTDFLEGNTIHYKFITLTYGK